MSFQIRTAARRRAISLTPMIDVVFLLLVFFMLAAQFETDRAIEISSAGSSDLAGPPRLIDVAEQGVTLNGVEIDESLLVSQVLALIGNRENVVVLRPNNGATVQRLVDIAEMLRDGGVANLAIVE